MIKAWRSEVMQRPLSSFPLASGHLAKLSSAGFETSSDLSDVGIVELSKGKMYDAAAASVSN